MEWDFGNFNKLRGFTSCDECLIVIHMQQDGLIVSYYHKIPPWLQQRYQGKQKCNWFECIHQSSSLTSYCAFKHFITKDSSNLYLKGRSQYTSRFKHNAAIFKRITPAQLTVTGIWYKIQPTSTRVCLLKIYAAKSIAGFCQALMDLIRIMVSYSKHAVKIIHCIFL